MKRSLLLAFLFATISLFGQKNVYLNINHLLGSQPFALNTASTNNLGQAFNTSRLEYYISSISLVHDGGIVTPVTDMYLLVNAKDSTHEMLGSFAITNLEGIKFGIGVDAAKNNLDPTTYPANHPLAPKSPSMHWGWAAGYRFIAFEGKTGPTLSYAMELHGLGNNNYYIQHIPTTGNLVGNDLTITLDADYTRILDDIIIENGVVNHGTDNEAQLALVNMNGTVFTSQGNSAMDLEENTPTVPKISMSPNPVNQQSLVTFNYLPENATVYITSITGAKQQVTVQNRAFSVAELPRGMYIVEVYKSGAQIAIERLIVN